MKKIMLLCFIGTFGLGISGCSVSKINDEDAEYEGVFTQVKVSDTIYLSDATVKEGNYYIYRITPSGFDYDELNKKNYRSMYITVNYYVNYKRTFSGWDIFYKGAPKFDVAIKNQDELGKRENGLEIVKDKRYTLNYSSPLMDLRNDKITFTVGSTNIQNEIYFTNMSVDYYVK